MCHPWHVSLLTKEAGNKILVRSVRRVPNVTGFLPQDTGKIHQCLLCHLEELMLFPFLFFTYLKYFIHSAKSLDKGRCQIFILDNLRRTF